MSRINFLTPEQKQQISVYRDKWIEIGLSAQPVDEERVRGICTDFYIHILEREPIPVIIMPSPLAAWLAVCRLGIEDQIRNRVWIQVWAQIWAQVGTQVRNQVRAQIGDQVGDQVRTQVWDQIEGQVWDQIRNRINNFICPSQGGQFFVNAFAFYDYMLNVAGVVIPDELSAKFDYWQATTQMGPIWPLDHVCVVSDRPSEIRRNEHGLHCDGGPALRYRDGFAVWALNGVRVSQEIAETAGGQLDCALIAKTQNAEVRREIVRKIGLERLFRDLHSAVLHEETYTALDVATMQQREHHYRLLMLDLGGGVAGYGLEMINPSTGTTHIEFVPQTCQTVGDALAFRNGTNEFPEMLS